MSGIGHPTIPCPCGQTAHPQPPVPADVMAEIERLRDRAEAAEAKLARIAELVQDTYMAEDILAVISGEGESGGG